MRVSQIARNPERGQRPPIRANVRAAAPTQRFAEKGLSAFRLAGIMPAGGCRGQSQPEPGMGKYIAPIPPVRVARTGGITIGVGVFAPR
jgi:hypothetical protein